MRNLSLLIVFLLSLNSNADTIPTQQAKSAGFKTCQNTVDFISNFVIDGHAHGSLSTWNNKDADNRLFNSLISIKYKDGNSVGVTNVTNGKTGKCDASYTTVFYVEKSCTLARETMFKEWKFSSELSGLMFLEDKKGFLNKILLPGGSGCVLITTEVVYP